MPLSKLKGCVSTGSNCIKHDMKAIKKVTETMSTKYKKIAKFSGIYIYCGFYLFFCI